MPPRNVHVLLRTIANQRGRTSEQRVLEACQLPGRPAWMKSARAATRAEDHDGIDVVVESDVGKLFVQVKSSRRGKADFEEKRRRARGDYEKLREGKAVGRPKKLQWVEAVLGGGSGSKPGGKALSLELPGGVRLEIADEQQAILAGRLIRELGR